MMKSAERNSAALAYLLAIVPLWGLLFDFLIWLSYRRSNRHVVFHAQQAIMLHALLLLVFICFSIMLMIINIVRAVNPAIAALLGEINQYILFISGAAYIGACCWGVCAILFFQQDNFKLPLIGRQLRINDSQMQE